MNIQYDSRIDTYRHIDDVRNHLLQVIYQLLIRQAEHDQSKLKSPEVEYFDKMTPMLRGMTYGSDEYMKCLADMAPAIKHHTSVNRHHPEHFPGGITGMTLIDLIEMLCDWKAATRRHEDGDIHRSIEINQKRFGYDDQIKQILLNTVPTI